MEVWKASDKVQGTEEQPKCQIMFKGEDGRQSTGLPNTEVTGDLVKFCLWRNGNANLIPLGMRGARGEKVNMVGGKPGSLSSSTYRMQFK
jgi:hypothetical protein